MLVTLLDKKEGRVILPSHVVPTRYDLSIEPDLEAFTFQGHVDISFKVNNQQQQPYRSVTLHAKELAFQSARAILEDGTKVAVDEIRMNFAATTVEFVFAPDALPSSGSFSLKVDYSGMLNNQMCGFYRSQYTDIHGNKKIMASTQFESIDARRAFPCVDEPAAKAVFALTLIVPQQLDCLSNMPEKTIATIKSGASNGNNNSVAKVKKSVTFMDTPQMSPYLLAFIVGEFDSVQAVSKEGVLVKVYTPPGKSDSGHYALDCAVRALDAYNAFFEVPYPLLKLDMVAIPEFAAGAMENWGLVTYREVDLLIDPIKASSSQKQRVAVVVTHELAHQWFGNLVTMQWWDDLWLNEGFASWCENWATNELFPEFKMWDQFTTGALASALRLDALRSSHPIQVPIHDAKEVEQVFDAISYCKGASVIRMIKAVLGMNFFRTGLVNYMKKYAYGNTETLDLWNAWEEVSKMPVAEMMTSWTEQMGFPLLKVVGEDWKADAVTLQLEQVWFLADGSELDEEGLAKHWTIPIMTCNENGPQEDMTLMRQKTATVTLPASKWVKLNAGQEVPMRVLPSEEMLKRLATGIQDKSMSGIDRAGLLTDAYALVKANHMAPEALMRLLASYRDEDSYVVWESISSALNGLDTVLSDDEAINANFHAFARSIVVNGMQKVGWVASKSDDPLTSMLRGILVNLLGTFAYDDESVASEASTRFKAFLENHDDVQSLPSDIRSPVFKIYLKNGTAKEYDEVKKYYYDATDNAERKHVLGSLGFISDPKLKLKTMEWSTSGEIKLQDFFYLMGSVGHSNSAGRQVAWKYFQDNFEAIKAMVANASSSLMDAVIVMCCSGFCSNEKADEIEAFFKDHTLPSSARKISQTLEGMRSNAKFLGILQASELSKPDFWSSL
ncbi:hypothetical protein MPSEU_000582700 [Mayamaea pseudoterrestris]|nr:hypothetical protein MPSEU_000582700 [Mayamaea pseudoterrestris]